MGVQSRSKDTAGRDSSANTQQHHSVSSPFGQAVTRICGSWHWQGATLISFDVLFPELPYEYQERFDVILTVGTLNSHTPCSKPVGDNVFGVLKSNKLH